MDPNEEIEENMFNNPDTDYLNDDDDTIEVDQELLASLGDATPKPAYQKTPEEIAAEEEAGKTEPGLFEKEEEEEGSEEDMTADEIAALNKKLGTDFKGKEDIKKLLKKDDEVSETEKEDAELKMLTTRVDLFQRYVNMNNESLVRENLLSAAIAAKKDINDQAVLDEIDEKIQGLKDLEQLDSTGELIRQNVKITQTNTQEKIDKITEKRDLAQKAVGKKNTEELQNAFAEIFNGGEFLGVTVTKEDIQDAFKGIRDKSFFERVNKDQGMIARLALFVKFEDQIKKIAGGPTHSDGIKKTLEEITGQNRNAQGRTITTARATASSDSSDLAKQFVQ